MNLRKGDSTGVRDGAMKVPAKSDDLAWMTRAGIDDCRITAASAKLEDLICAHRIMMDREGCKTRRRIVAAAMKRRFGIVVGSDVILVKKGETP